MSVHASIASRSWRQGVAVLAMFAGACHDDSLKQINTKTDEFEQVAAAAVDILWVVDNSQTMQQEQQGLGESFEVFIDNLATSDVDYHIGVISTDPADGGILHKGGASLPAFIDRQTDDPEAVFLKNVKVGVNGAANEKALETTALALGKGLGWHPGESASPPNPGFLRDDAALFIIMVSDEEDGSFGPVDYYWRLIESYKGPGNEARISVSAIVGPPPEGDSEAGGCYDSARGAAIAGLRYIELASLTGGVFTSICDDFNESTASLSITAAGLKSIYTLSSQPNTEASVKCDTLEAGPFCVRVNGEAMAPGRNNRQGYKFDKTQNAIVSGTDAVPAPQAKILVEYREVR